MFKLHRFIVVRPRFWRLSLFEKVILANSIILIGEALAGLWVTSHNIEAHHYLIDTSFLIGATLIGILINVLLLRASFRPLFTLLTTIRAVSAGKTNERSAILASDAEIAELAYAFNTMLDRLETTRREQATLILQAQEEERRHLALELHDESGQNLTALLVHIEILAQSLQNSQAPSDTALSNEARRKLEQGLHYLSVLTQNTLENIRTLSQQLRPSVLDDLGLAAAFRWLAEDGHQRLQLPVELHLEGIEDLPHCKQPALYETALFRIAQECLTNVARHAQAEHVFLSLIQKKDEFHLCVGDDGCGYNPSLHTKGSGVFGMRERATSLGGTFDVQSQPGQGTLVQVTLPLPVQRATERTEGIHV
ncbi:MAG: sensor histidine kinase [Chloroflexota bacterium]|nr:sensor histidine kinase [Chloroflexota bacterium]